MPPARVRLVAALVLCMPLLAGCGGRPKPVTVKGVVTFDGQPLPRATVLFIAQDPGGRDANGYTNEAGEFELSTFTPKDGALPGAYKVVIQYAEEGATPNYATPEEAQKAGAKAGGPKKGAITIPPAYAEPDKTVLRQQVPADGVVQLELRSDKR